MAAVWYPKSQEIIDDAISRRLRSIHFTKKPVYNGRLKHNGRTLITLEGMKKTVRAVEIGRQESPSEEWLLNTIIHEELEARIAERANRHWHGKFGAMYPSPPKPHDNKGIHKYIYAVLERYFRMRGWKK